MSRSEPAASFGDVCSILREIRVAVHSRANDTSNAGNEDESVAALRLLDHLDKGAWWKSVPHRP